MKKVFCNGKIYTGTQPAWANYIVVENGVIAEVGTGLPPAYPEAEKTDLGGRLMLPGFIDAHAHPFTSAFQLSQIALDYRMSEDEVLEVVKGYIAVHPEKSSYFGSGYAETLFGKNGPKKEALDAVCPHKPILLLGAGGHDGWANTKALQAAGVDKEHPEPVPGLQYYKRDAEGEPTGYLVEYGPIAEVVQAIKPFVQAEAELTLDKILKDFSSYGVTSIIDCGFIGYMHEEACRLLDKLRAGGGQRQRIFGSLQITEPGQLQDWEPRLRALKEQYDDDLVRFNTWKLVNDGTIESSNAAMSEPFAEGGELSQPLLQGESYYRLCREVARKGYNLHLHGIGDKAIHENLMAARAVREAGCRDTIITNAHTQCVREADLPLFAKYRVIANTTGVWHYGDPKSAAKMGKWGERQFMLKSILRCGGSMSLGSDFPGDEYGPQPLHSIETAMTRRLNGEPMAAVLQPETEALSLEELIRGFTLTPARQVRMEEKLGTIEAGKYADFVVLERDIFETDPYELHRVPVYMTVMNGRVTYQS